MIWQVTCDCGWRVKGTKEEIVAKVQEHGRTAHARELSDDEVLAIAVPLEQT